MHKAFLRAWLLRCMLASLLGLPNMAWSLPSVLVIVCEGGAATGAPTSQLMASGYFSSVTAHDCANGVPDLSPYQAVLMYTDYGPPANVFGDALANFVDAGGGVVLSTYAMTSGWNIGGRIFNPGYSPFPVSPSASITYSGTLVQQVSHPVFNGINLGALTYWQNGNYINPTLTAGSTMLAKDAYGYGMVAVNASGRIIANNIYPNANYGNSAEFYKLLANELAFVATPAKPGGLSGAVWWSRADSLSQSDASDIATWNNEVNPSKSLTGSATRPKFRNHNALNINFNPVVEFTSATASDAGAQFFSASSFLGTSTWNQAHYVMVGYLTEVPQNNWVYFEDAVNSADGNDGRLSFHMGWASARVYWDAGACCNANRTNYFDYSLVNQPSIWLFNMDTVTPSPSGAKQGIRRDGLVKATASAPNPFTGNNSNFRVGYQGLDAPFRGVMAEGMLFLGTPMSNTQATQLESYLGVKYGGTIGGNGATGTSYLNSAGGTIWSANTGYHTNIVGIGRDDTTKLNQLISRSVNAGDQITIISGTAMPSSASAITPTTGATALATDRSYTLIGDNGQSATGTAAITVGPQAGRTRSARIWRLQMTGTVPNQLSICIPDSMLPSGFTSGSWASDLWLSTATAEDFSTGTAQATMTAATCVASGVGVTSGVPGRLATISNTVLNGMGGVGYFTVTRKLLDHIEITASSSTGVTCAPTTYTLKACGDATCSSLYTGGLTGTLGLTGTGVTAVFPSGASFSIASGSATTTLVAQVTTPSTATVGATGLSLTPANAKPVWCGLGTAASNTASCAMTVADAGFLFDVLDHRSGNNQTIVLSAVKKADNSLACAPAFTGAKSVNFKCQYLNPASGTLPILVSGVGLNAAAVATSACDATGSNRTLTFDANGQVSTTVQYSDVGQMRLSASWSSSSGSDAGLSLTGSDTFIAVPHSFSISGYPTGAIKAGQGFAVTVTAINAAGTATPNFGLESVPERPALSFYRAKPSGSAAVDGAFTTGSPGSPSAGAYGFSGNAWSEVGRAEITAKLQSGSYLGSGWSVVKTTGSWTYCAAAGGSCTLPAGATYTVSWDAGGAAITYAHGRSGSFSCSQASFLIDPLPGAAKSCYYMADSGSRTSDPGSLLFTPNNLTLSATPACSSFSYAGQPFGLTLTAKNAAGVTTQNYDGSTNTSPNFARAISLSEASGNATGALSGSVPASSFSAGVATLANTAATAPVFSFSNKLTAPQTISVRATDADGVNSSGYDASQTLRSGRLMLSNAFGGDKQSLQIPLQLQYWSGKSWVPNSADTCTVIPAASVVRARTLNHNNTAATWSSAVSGLSLAGGNGTLTLGAPSPSGTGTVDVAINLGSGASDNSCNPVNGTATGANLPWLRSRQGSCASSFDRDPSARASFGVYSPETKRAVHVRDIF